MSTYQPILARLLSQRPKGGGGGRLGGWGVVVAAVVAWVAGAAQAQTDTKPTDPAPASARASDTPSNAVASYEGRQIREVVLRRLDDKGSAVQGEDGLLTGDALTYAQNNIRTQVGGAFAVAMANADIRRLADLGQFDLLSVQVTGLTDGTVRVTFYMRLRPIIRDVQVVGNRAISDGTIRDIVSPLVGTPQSADQIKNYQDRVERVYKEKGYYGARVSVDQHALETQGVLVFRVREGRETKIADVRFEGNLTFSAGELSHGLKAQGPLLIPIQSTKVNEDDLAADVAQITAYYKDRGYYAARVGSILETSPDGSEAIVTYSISEGPVYTLRRVTAVRATDDEEVLSDQQILGLLSIKPGDVYGRDTVNRSVQTVQDAYWTMGYDDARVEARELRDPNSPQIDLLLVINEGARFYCGEIVISGNERTQQKVVRRQITFQSGRPLDRTQERETIRRLNNLQIFEPGKTRITLQPPTLEEPEFRDILVEIQETNTGQFAAGGTVSSDGGIGARISLTERNFDASKLPHSIGELFGGGYRGGGQTFNIEIAPGDRNQRFGISLEEPSLFESNYAGSVSAILNNRVYPQFDQFQYGTNFAIGRSFGSRWIGRMPVRVQWTELSSLDAAAPVDYYQVKDLALLTSVGISLSRITLDNPARPSKGSHTQVSVEQVGALGGEYDFTNIRAEHRFFVPMLEDVLGRRTVLRVSTSTSYIPQSAKAVPVYERAYLGGQDFRGFDLRGIGPRGIRNDTGLPGNDPVGGNFSFFLGAEVQQPLYSDVLSLAMFLDTGTVNTNFSLDHYRVSTGLGFRVLLPISPVPLAFDFGFPLVKESYDQTRLFTFSIDVPF